MSVYIRSRRSWRIPLAVAALTCAVAASPVVLWAQASGNPAPIAVTASAQTPLSLTEAFRLALEQQPWISSRAERQREQQARLIVADSWFADTPTIASSLRAGSRDSLREFEIEISAPIATTSRRNLQVATARGEASAYAANVSQQTLKLASEVREAYWAAPLAAGEVALTDDENTRAEALARDSARRTTAGESARVDTLQAQAALQLARSYRAEAQQRLANTRQTFRALVGEAAIHPLMDSPEASPDTADSLRADHPLLRNAEQSIVLARAKLKEASMLVNAAPTLSFTLGNERTSNSGSTASSTTARIGVSVPFGGAQRATPRIAQASAELAEAQSQERLVRRQLIAEIDGAKAAHAASELRVAILVERASLATEVATLYAKAFRLGELDLPTRLRVEGERAAALLALTRARIERHAAISRANQSLGLLP